MPRAAAASRWVPSGKSQTSLPQAGAEPGLEEESPAFAATVEEPRKERTPRLDWAGLLRRTFALEVLACLRCGGRLKGVGVREGSRWGESDCGAPGVAHGECAPGPCARAAPERVVLKLKPPQPATREPGPCRAPPGKAAGLGRRVSAGDERLLRRLGVRLMGSPSASLTSRSAPARYAQEGSCPSYAHAPHW
jgi:hypothetical protein